MNQDIQLSRQQRKAVVEQMVDSMRSSQTATDMLDEAFTEFLGINRSDGRCLDVVDRWGQVTAGELAAEVGLTTGAVTAMVDRLESAGLLRRARDPDDRRKVVIQMTDEAQELADEIYGEIARATAPYVEALSDADLLTLISFFEASRSANLELAEAVRRRAPKRKVSLKQRVDQAKALKDEAKNLLKTMKSEMKGLVKVVVVTGDTEWVKDESGRWVEVKGEEQV